MRRFVHAVFISVLLAVSVLAQTAAEQRGRTVRIDPDPEKGFSNPYYLFIPPALLADPGAQGTHTLLVSPNNTGRISDDPDVHERNVKIRLIQASLAFARLNVPILMPVFPRPETHWKIYTHALDRDALTTDLPQYKRFDLQLAAMIRDARVRLAGEDLAVGDRVLMYGFSAAGMFVNRFAFLHPELVKAAAIGSPGGWPIAPAESFKGKTLRYPVGIGDLEVVAGRTPDLAALKEVRFFIFMGSLDDNDSLVFRDGYEEEDETLVFELFGKLPVERWDTSRRLYEEAGLRAEFRLYEGESHKTTRKMIEDASAFLEANKY